MTGNFLALKFKNSVTKLGNPKLVVLIWVGFFFSLLGLYINSSVNIFYMGTILYSIAIFIYAYNNPNKYFNKSFEIIGAKYSLFIYIVHIFIYSCIEKLAGKANLKDNPVYQWSKPFIVAITTLVCAILFYRVFDIIKNKKQTIA
jgi:peptidoglycan/LPS O-acetylase OafA/YrhL